MATAKYPSFKAIVGRDAQAGEDYDPDGAMCQDDYEYFNGTGAYTNDAWVLMYPAEDCDPVFYDGRSWGKFGEAKIYFEIDPNINPHCEWVRLAEAAKMV